MSDKEFNECAKIVAKEIIDKYVNGDLEPEALSDECSLEKNACCCQN